MGRVVRLEDGEWKVFPPRPPQAILQRGYWYEVKNKGLAAKALAAAKGAMMGIPEERQDEILVEETLENMPRTADANAEEKAFRRSIRRDVRWMKSAGVQIVIPNREPKVDMAKPKKLPELTRKSNPRDRFTYTGEPGEIRPAQCNNCAHNKGNGTCRAFPKKAGIPYDILVNNADHRKRFRGDGDYRWAPVDDTPHPLDVMPQFPIQSIGITSGFFGTSEKCDSVKLEPMRESDSATGRRRVTTSRIHAEVTTRDPWGASTGLPVQNSKLRSQTTAALEEAQEAVVPAVSEGRQADWINLPSGQCYG